MTITPVEPRCEHCRYRFESDALPGNLMCRRYPPSWQGISADGTAWSSSPFTRPDHWCGEFVYLSPMPAGSKPS